MKKVQTNITAQQLKEGRWLVLIVVEVKLLVNTLVVFSVGGGVKCSLT